MKKVKLANTTVDYYLDKIPKLKEVWNEANEYLRKYGKFCIYVRNAYMEKNYDIYTANDYIYFILKLLRKINVDKLHFIYKNNVKHFIITVEENKAFFDFINMIFVKDKLFMNDTWECDKKTTQIHRAEIYDESLDIINALKCLDYWIKGTKNGGECRFDFKLCHILELPNIDYFMDIQKTSHDYLSNILKTSHEYFVVQIITKEKMVYEKEYKVKNIIKTSILISLEFYVEPGEKILFLIKPKKRFFLTPGYFELFYKIKETQRMIDFENRITYCIKNKLL